MIFLVGLPRSGTNWLERILSSRPDVVAIPGETYLFARGIRYLTTQTRHSMPDAPGVGTIYAEETGFRQALRSLCDRVLQSAAGAVDGSAHFIVERTPLHVFHLDLIGRLYPDARVVHIIRDGRDVARSMLNQDWGPRTVQAAASDWVAGIRAARSAAPLFHRYVEVRYEDLLADPASRIPELYRSLDLPDDPAVLDGALAAAAVAFNIDPADPRIGRDKWRDSWTDDQGRAFDDIAGPLLSELGYEPLGLEATTDLPDRAAGAGGLSARRRRLRGPRRSPVDGGQTVAAFVAHLRRQDFRSAAQLLAPDCHVQFLTPANDWSATGPQGAMRLVSSLLAEAGEWEGDDSAEVRGRGSSYVAVISRADNSSHRMLHFDIDDERVRRLEYVWVPLSGARRDEGWVRGS